MTPKLVFVFERPPEGGYIAQALGHSIYTEANTWDELNTALQDAVACHFGEDPRPTKVAMNWHGDSHV